MARQCIALDDPKTGSRKVAGVHWDFNSYGGELKKAMGIAPQVPSAYGLIMPLSTWCSLLTYDWVMGVMGMAYELQGLPLVAGCSSPVIVCSYLIAACCDHNENRSGSEIGSNWARAIYEAKS